MVPAKKTTPRVERIVAGARCCIAIANGGPPAAVMVPMMPLATPAIDRLVVLGCTRQPRVLRLTAARISTANRMDSAWALNSTSSPAAAKVPMTRPTKVAAATWRLRASRSRRYASKASGAPTASKGPGTSSGKKIAANGAQNIA